MSRSIPLTLTVLLLGTGSLPAQPADPALRDAAVLAMRKAASFYRSQAVHGGYVYYSSLDLKNRWGEGTVSADTILVQPPGTPTVGRAYLAAYAATGDRFYLDAARDAAAALVRGQLQSGGWTQVIHFGPAQRLGKYRKMKGGSWNFSSLDDGQTQAALKMLVRADRALDFKDADIHQAALQFLALTDRALDFKDAAIHDAAAYGLAALLKAQFPNGGFPQVWTGPVARKPVVKARYPDHDWKTEEKLKNYWDHYTLNDGLAGTVSETLTTAHEVYRDEKYTAAIRKLGDFLVLAQMPDPQPGWCQQYNDEMEPMWARKFEPPAVTGWESQDAMRTLIRVARSTGQPKYLEPIPRALAYLKKSLLPDGRLARFYELKTNKPLYMDRQYRLTNDDSDLPGHYGWTQPARLDEIEADYRITRTGQPVPGRVRSAKDVEADVRRILRELDDDGRWVSIDNGERLVGQPGFKPGFRYLSSERFSRNLETLAEYVASTRK